MVGYKRLMAADARGTLARLARFRAGVVAQAFTRHGGRLVKTAGDGLIAEFPNAADAVLAAEALQRGAEATDADMPRERRLMFRVGVAVGEIMVADGDVFGHAVNLAARLEGMAQPGMVLMSDDVRAALPARLGEPLLDNGRRRFRNVAEPVRVWSWPCRLPAAVGRKPRVALAALDVRDPNGELLASGLASELRARLARFTGLAVAEDRAHADYAVEGEARLVGSRARLYVRLVSIRDARQVWSDRYDMAMEDMFDLLDHCAARVATSVRRRVAAAEAERTAGTPLDELSFEELLAYAGTRFYIPTKAGWRAGGEAAEQALALIDDDSMALAMAAAGLGLAEEIYGFGRTDRKVQALAFERTHRALVARNTSDMAHTVHAGLLIFGRGRHADGRAAAERALDLNPDYNMGWWTLAAAQTFAGDYDAGAESAARAAALEPDDPYVHLYARIAGLAHFAAKRYGDAAAWFSTSDRLAPGVEATSAGLAAARQAAGDTEGAAEATRRLTRSTPAFRLSAAEPLPFRDSKVWDDLDAALRRAGVPL